MKLVRVGPPGSERPAVPDPAGAPLDKPGPRAVVELETDGPGKRRRAVGRA